VISVLIPVYNEEENLRVIHERLSSVLGAMSMPYELLFINDGSKDQSLAIIRDLCAADEHSRFISFSIH
jgi:dolichol-phosphate mannosyltransferase